MEITNIQSFLRYYSKIKSRTRRLLDLIPSEKMEWAYAEGRFTPGDLIRHLACTERYMYAETVQGKQSSYPGCGTDLAEGKEAVIEFYDRLHEESLEIFSKLTPEDLNKKCFTPAGTPITTWKWMRAMVEHEVHHRGQLYDYLGMFGVVAPPLFGLTEKEMAAGSNGKK